MVSRLIKFFSCICLTPLLCVECLSCVVYFRVCWPASLDMLALRCRRPVLSEQRKAVEFAADLRACDCWTLFQIDGVLRGCNTSIETSSIRQDSDKRSSQFSGESQENVGYLPSVSIDAPCPSSSPLSTPGSGFLSFPSFSPPGVAHAARLFRRTAHYYMGPPIRAATAVVQIRGMVGWDQDTFGSRVLFATQERHTARHSPTALPRFLVRKCFFVPPRRSFALTGMPLSSWHVPSGHQDPRPSQPRGVQLFRRRSRDKDRQKNVPLSQPSTMHQHEKSFPSRHLIHPDRAFGCFSPLPERQKDVPGTHIALYVHLF